MANFRTQAVGNGGPLSMCGGRRVSVQALVVHQGRHGGVEAQYSFDEFYNAYYRDLVAYCRRHLGTGGDPEAIAQEAFTRAWTAWGRYTASRPFWPWMVTIARRLCIDYRRREVRHAELPEAVTMWMESSALPEERLEIAEERRHALIALGHLKPEARRVVELRDIDGWSYEQIANFEGVTVESIRGSLKRARIALRRAYDRVAQDTSDTPTWDAIVLEDATQRV